MNESLEIIRKMSSVPSQKQVEFINDLVKHIWILEKNVQINKNRGVKQDIELNILSKLITITKNAQQTVTKKVAEMKTKYDQIKRKHDDVLMYK